MLGSARRAICRQLVMLSILLVSARADGAGPKRVALVIGNGAYRFTQPLSNPVNDAHALGTELRRLGFDVEVGLDLDRTGMMNAFHRFARRSSGADVALFFYGGHGLQVGERNYLVPIQAKLEHEADLAFEMLDIQHHIEPLKDQTKVLIVLLDACRNNPLANRLRSRTRSVGRGLALMNIERGEILIAYATSPGQLAADGDGANSPFTAALLKHIGARGLEVQVMFKRVTGSVKQQTGDRQRPWVHASLASEVYLAGAPSAGSTHSVELDFWMVVKDSEDPADLLDYLNRYPGGQFVSLARRRYEAASRRLARRGPGPRRDEKTDPKGHKRGGQSVVDTVVTPD